MIREQLSQIGSFTPQLNTLACGLILLLVGCASNASRDNFASRFSDATTKPELAIEQAVPSPKPPLRVGPYGLECYGWELPDSPGPATYSIKDLGKAEVPRLDSATLQMINKIIKFEPHAELRFFLPDGPKHVESVALFEATDGSCPPSGIRYAVLNRWPPALYQPGEDAFNLEPAAGGGRFTGTPFPWLSPPEKI